MTSAAALSWAVLIMDSFRTRTGRELIARSGDEADDARSLFEAERVVLCHDGAADPVFVYANRLARMLWRTEGLVGMPSRLSAAPDERDTRRAMLDRASAEGVLTGYSGVRRAADGTRFEIRDATVWTVDLDGRAVGQAATFTEWALLADDAPGARSARGGREPGRPTSG
jgi:hypothetical protein